MYESMNNKQNVFELEFKKLKLHIYKKKNNNS